MDIDTLFIQKMALLAPIEENDFVNYLYPIYFTKPITLFIGDNGVGKSTILESLAVHLGCPAEGGSRNFNFKTEDTHLDYSAQLRVTKGYKQARDVFFYRSETFYTFMSEMRKLDSEVVGGAKINGYYGHQDLHTLSHGESMKALYHHRFYPESLYILDEPEAALSIHNQLQFIEKIIKLSRMGSQFIIATHSPLLMLMPEVDLLQITQQGINKVNFAETDIYYLYRELMSDKGADYLQSILNLD